MRLSPLALSVPRSRIREISELAVGLDGVLKLYFGESNVATPDFIKAAGSRALDESHTFYTHNAGYLDLRRAVADQVHMLHGVQCDPETEVLVTASGVTGLLLECSACSARRMR